jgi:hypothetical protein
MPEPFQLNDALSIEIEPLNAYESIIADEYVNGFDAIRITKVYALCSIRKVNGEQVKPLQNKTEFIALASRFSVGELGQILEHFSIIAMPAQGDDLKNSSSAPTLEA